MLTWGSTLPVLFLLAATTEKQKSNPAIKYIWIIVVLLALGAIIVLMLRSMGVDSRTPPSVILRKIRIFFLSSLRPFLVKKKLAQAEEFDSKGDARSALPLYVGLFDFDGMFSSNSKLAIHNETILERIEDICDRSGYDFPSEQINRFREDIFDYHLVRQRYLNPSDYDGTPLHRKENEERFKNKLNFSQENELIEGFRHFMTTFGEKLLRHLSQGRPIAKPKPKPKLSDSSSSLDSLPASSVEVSLQDEEQALPLPPQKEPVSVASRKEASPFAVNDPRSPFQDTTGTLRRLPGAEDDQALQAKRPTPPPASDPFGSFLDKKAAANGHAAAAPPPASTAFPPLPGLPQAPSAFPPLGAAPSPQGQAARPGFPGASTGFPSPTSAFPNFGATAPKAPTPSMSSLPASPGFPGSAPLSPSPSMANLPAFPGANPGAFPGFGPQSPAPGMPANPGFPGAAPGAFPGFGPQPQAAQAPKPPMNPMAPMAPTSPGAPLGPAAAPRAPGFPAPTGAFPGFNPSAPSNPSNPLPGFPAPTGAFPGFGQQPSQTQNPTPGFPAPTGAFPGFPSPNPFGQDPKKK